MRLSKPKMCRSVPQIVVFRIFTITSLDFSKTGLGTFVNTGALPIPEGQTVMPYATADFYDVILPNICDKS